ncbi:MAG: hypothetical protein IKF65_02295, partial [Clostridia bacterium]|nr:hypothetical protein [Clostridia bacterium]
NMQTIETYVIDDSRLNEYLDELCEGNRYAIVEPEPDSIAFADYICEFVSTATAASPEKVGNLVEFAGKVTKIENDANGVLGVIHVNDGSGEVLVFFDGYINCDDGCTPGEDGYHDLSWIKEGTCVMVRGIASIGQNSYENSDQIGPRIRIRNRADIVKVLYGDANGDGVVTSADAALVLRATVGLSRLTLMGAFCADVTSDFNQMPNSADAAAILRYVVGIINEFEVEAIE